MGREKAIPSAVAAQPKRSVEESVDALADLLGESLGALGAKLDDLFIKISDVDARVRRLESTPVAAPTVANGTVLLPKPDRDDHRARVRYAENVQVRLIRFLKQSGLEQRQIEEVWEQSKTKREHYPTMRMTASTVSAMKTGRIWKHPQTGNWYYPGSPEKYDAMSKFLHELGF